MVGAWTGFSDSFTLTGRTVYDLSTSLDLAKLRRKFRSVTPGWLPERLIASAGLANLTDRSTRDSVGFPQPGRTFTFGVEGRW